MVFSFEDGIYMAADGFEDRDDCHLKDIAKHRTNQFPLYKTLPQLLETTRPRPEHEQSTTMLAESNQPTKTPPPIELFLSSLSPVKDQARIC